MNSSLDLRVQRSLQLLGNLKQTVAQFAKREELLARELSGHRYTVSQAAQEATAAKEANHSAQVAQVEAYCHAESQRIQKTYDARQDRINRYSSTRLRNLPRLAQELKGKWQGDLQMRNYQAERKMAADLVSADADYPGFSTKLEAHWKNLLSLEKQAKAAFRGYLSLRFRLGRKRPMAFTEDSSLNQIQSDVSTHLSNAEKQLFEFQQFALPRFFSYAPLPVFFLLAAAVIGVSFWQLGKTPTTYIVAAATVAVFVAVWITHAVSLARVKSLGLAIAHALVESRQIIQSAIAAGPAMAAKRENIRQAIQQAYEATRAEIDSKWGQAESIEQHFDQSQRRKLETQMPRLNQKIDATLNRKLRQIETQRLAWHEQLNNNNAIHEQQIAEQQSTGLSALTSHEQSGWDQIVADWHREITPIYQEIDAIQTATNAKFPAWDPALVEAWMPPIEFLPATKFGSLGLDLTKSGAALPKDPRLALPGPSQVSLPLALTFPAEGSLLFETKDSGSTSVIGTVNNVILRLLSTTPPGKLSFTFIDPVGLGQNFSGLMHLADYEESLVNRRIWTQRDQIEERLAELSEHIEKVIQMYLRNEYATITEYNEKAGSVAEKYYFLVVADFPANFSEIAVKRLQSIAQSGPRCGIFTLVHWDQRLPAEGPAPDELRKSSLCFRRTGTDWLLNKQQTDLGVTLAFDTPATPELAVELVHKIGKASIDSNRVQVPFSQVAPTPGEEWTGDTTNELRIAVGRTGATKLQYLAIGKGTRQHALFAGKTGSGKSTLFHVIITNLALTCSPDQVQFYLIDFKKGVEFKCYATRHLPHAKVIAIESDREFALSVLQRVDEELKRRGDMFRKLGVQDVAGYKRAGGPEPMPRTLLLIDEFQEFFVEDDTIAQGASLLFDRIVRQGRAFGIHVLLGSQSLGGAYTLARTTLGQMAIRVALQCNEADAYLIMDETNSAPRLLSRPGEGIYNDSAGAVEGNSPFQVVWLPDNERDVWLDKVETLVAQHPDRHYSGPIVFEGNSPADISENELLRAALATVPAAPPIAARAWLGAPNSIKGPTEATFSRQSSSNLLIVGQREEPSLTMLGLSLVALAAQYPPGAAKFLFFHQAAAGSSEANFVDEVIKAIPHEVLLVRGQDVSPAINDLAVELKARTTSETSATEAPPIFLFIHGLQKFKKLRHEDDFSFSMSSEGEGAPDSGAQFNQIITEGSGYGIHILTTVDTLSSVNRFMNRKALGEFAMRVIFQMSANDSASLIDSPRASLLGLHRALYYHEQEGYLETFRPYATPDPAWFQHLAEKRAR